MVHSKHNQQYTRLHPVWVGNTEVGYGAGAHELRLSEKLGVTKSQYPTAQLMTERSTGIGKLRHCVLGPIEWIELNIIHPHMSLP